jgi:hypothetical protein
MSSAMRKAKKQMARDQAKRDRKIAKRDNSKSTNEVLGLRNVTDVNKRNFAQNFGFNLNSAWYFNKWYEKLILVVLSVFGMWKIVGFF